MDQKLISISQAAKKLNVDHRTLIEQLKKNDIDVGSSLHARITVEQFELLKRINSQSNELKENKGFFSKLFKNNKKLKVDSSLSVNEDHIKKEENTEIPKARPKLKVVGKIDLSHKKSIDDDSDKKSFNPLDNKPNIKTDNDSEINAKAEEIKGLTVSGKVDLSSFENRRKKKQRPGTSDSNTGQKKRKRKRVPVGGNSELKHNTEQRSTIEKRGKRNDYKGSYKKGEYRNKYKGQKKEEQRNPTEELWYSYIDAKQKMLADKLMPYRVLEEGQEVNKKFVKLKLDDSFPVDKVKNVIRGKLGDSIEEIDLQNGFVNCEFGSKFPKEKLEELELDLKPLFFEFTPKPVIEGSIRAKKNIFEFVSNQLKENGIDVQFQNHKSDRFSFAQLKLKDIEAFDNVISNHGLSKYFKREESFGVKFISLMPDLDAWLRDKVKSKGFENSFEFYSYRNPEMNIFSIGVINSKLTQDREKELLNELGFETNYKECQYELIVKKSNKDIVVNILNKEFLHDSLIITEEDIEDSTYSKIKLKKTIFGIYNGIEEVDIHSYLFGQHLKNIDGVHQVYYQVVRRYLYKNGLNSCNNTFRIEYSNEISESLSKLKNVQFRSFFHPLYFEVSNQTEFDEAISILNALPNLKNNFKDDTVPTFKIRIEAITKITQYEKNLIDHFPDIETTISPEGDELSFKYFYDLNKVDYHDLLDYFEKRKGEDYFSTEINGEFEVKFILKQSDELRKEILNSNFKGFIGDDFFINRHYDDKTPQLKLREYKFPDLKFEILESSSSLGNIRDISPSLKGDVEKILRLENTVKTLSKDGRGGNNNRFKDFIFDSSKAKPIEDKSKIKLNSDEYFRLKDRANTKTLNDSQWGAVLKSLHAEDLVLLQGPPGTGKSSTISEIIWQHLLDDQQHRILLTSESKLAVDNAIDRIDISNNNLIKPIRFGRNIEPEGMKFSIDLINNWANKERDEEPEEYKSITQIWVENIARRVSKSERNIDPRLFEEIQNRLINPSKYLRKLFSETYLEYVNVVGATSGSIGEKSSEGKPTGFYYSYVETFKHHKNKKSKKSKHNIWFDTVIMDEASKAVPPELALPLMYGNKSIIVGDHRQLPPMLDENEIKQGLVRVRQSKLLKNITEKELNASQFEKLFLNPNADSSIKATFDTQYRMHPDINDVIKQFYVEDGGLNCGLPSNNVNSPDFENKMSRYHGITTFDNNGDEFINPDVHVMWVDVDEPEVKEGTSRINIKEVDAIRGVLKSFENSESFLKFQEIQKSAEDKEIGVISFYGRQLNYLDELKEEFNIPLRVRTVDKFQGMERNIVIVSMVRSNKIADNSFAIPNLDLYPNNKGYRPQETLGFAESPNRLNVALSRAKRLLIIVGNKTHFSRHSIYNNVANTIEENPNSKIIDYKLIEQ
ncbi:DEAD/DEAH box helicase [Flammeovirga sp. EKP202]|uniref:DEAD/DEAH box helicase n=1 Tax=Flammeovirga sp. EKP202 TaxID=2770592 RepID=UPI00165F199A|nr:AAA domain-containing protein [Flammeovirga sp. EKP202]MBD0402932.1 hypothetical protein [Flammeovirga sp. EKP202]